MKHHYLLSPLLLLGLTACQEDVIECNHPQRSSSRYQEQSAAEIISFYLSISSKGTRSLENYTIEPIVSGKDTIMYLANYDGNGWTLFSNDKRAKMVLMSSEEGSLSRKDIDEGYCSISEYIASLKESLLLLASDNSISQIDSSWELFSNSGLLPLKPDTIGPFPGHLGGHYELISPLTITYDTINTGHLCLTKWGQSTPWNQYIPLKNNIHCLAGCAPVATAQFLFFQHYRIGYPQMSPSSAYYNATNNYYIFSNYSSLIWDSMALKQKESNTEYSAMLIGSVAKEIVYPNQFDTLGTASYIANMIDYISSCGLNLVQMDYSDSCVEKIKETLIAGDVLLANGFRTRYNEEENKNETVGHSFLIDGLVQHIIHTSGIYAIYEDLISDITGEIISTNFQGVKQIEKTDISYYFLMNWGWNGKDDDTWCSSNIYEGWSPNNNRNYNLLREVYYLQSN